MFFWGEQLGKSGNIPHWNKNKVDYDYELYGQMSGYFSSKIVNRYGS